MTVMFMLNSSICASESKIAPLSTIPQVEHSQNSLLSLLLFQAADHRALSQQTPRCDQDRWQAQIISMAKLTKNKKKWSLPRWHSKVTNRSASMDLSPTKDLLDQVGIQYTREGDDFKKTNSDALEQT